MTNEIIQKNNDIEILVLKLRSSRVEQYESKNKGIK